MTWLAHGVPLALLADLADPSGPRSREIYTAEAVQDDVRLDLRSLQVDRPAEAPANDFSGARTA